MTLADLVVSFKAVGVEAVETAVTGIKAAAEGLTASLGHFGTAATAAFAAAEAAVAGYARAGFQGTVQAEQLALANQRLAREVASLFIPAIEGASKAVNALADWFRTLTGAQQEATAALLAGAAAAGVAAAALAFFFPELELVNIAIGAIAAGLTAATAVTGWFWDAIKGLWEALGPLRDAITDVFDALSKLLDDALKEMGPDLKNIINAVAEIAGDIVRMLGTIAEVGFWAFLEVLKFVVSMLSKLADLLHTVHEGLVAIGLVSERKDKKGGVMGEGHRDVALAGGQFEGIADQYRRIASAVMKLNAGKTPEEESRDYLKEIEKHTGATARKVGAIEPGLA